MNLTQQLLLLMLPVVLLSGVCGTPFWRAVEPKARCWTVMMAASLATYAFDPVEGNVPFAAYAAIDFLGCVAVSARRYHCPQRLIAGGFLVMFLLDIVALASGHSGGGYYQRALDILGLSMCAVLFLWSFTDAGRGVRYHYHRWRRSRSDLSVAAHLSPRRPGGQR